MFTGRGRVNAVDKRERLLEMAEQGMLIGRGKINAVGIRGQLLKMEQLLRNTSEKRKMEVRT